MIFAFWMIDQPGMLETRNRIRPEHKDHLASVETGIHFAGPLMDETGQHMIGSLLAIDFPDRQAAEAWLAAEPFNQAGVYQRIEIIPMQPLWPRATYDPQSLAQGAAAR